MKIKLWCRTHDLQSYDEDLFDPSDFGIELQPDGTLSDKDKEFLQKEAEDNFYNVKEPEWGFQIVNDDEE